MPTATQRFRREDRVQGSSCCVGPVVGGIIGDAHVGAACHHAPKDYCSEYSVSVRPKTKQPAVAVSPWI